MTDAQDIKLIGDWDKKWAKARETQDPQLLLEVIDEQEEILELRKKLADDPLKEYLDRVMKVRGQTIEEYADTIKQNLSQSQMFREFHKFNELMSVVSPDIQALIMLGTTFYHEGYGKVISARVLNTNVCDVCYEPYTAWFAPDSYWKQLPKDLWNKDLCFGCFCENTNLV